MPEYQFKCVYCGEIKVIEKRITEPMPQIIECAKGHMMYRDYQGEGGGKSVIIPANMRATSKGN